MYCCVLYYIKYLTYQNGHGLAKRSGFPKIKEVSSGGGSECKIPKPGVTVSTCYLGDHATYFLAARSSMDPLLSKFIITWADTFFPIINFKFPKVKNNPIPGNC